MSECLNLELHFEGIFQCRLATDPDPPSEKRGVSGYTFALAHESPLSQKICLQRDEIKDCDFRAPFPPYLEDERPEFGVFVRRVLLNGKEFGHDELDGAAVRLLGNAQFEIRNQIVADGVNQLAPAISPFEIEIRGQDGALLRRFDPLDPADPKSQIWELSPEQYKRRVPVNFFMTGSEALSRLFPGELKGQLGDLGAINTFYNGYFESRKQWLELQISIAEARRERDGNGDNEALDVQIEGYRTRVYAIDQHTRNARMENRLGLQTVWEHDLVGAGIAESIPGGIVETKPPWRTGFWIGGWDGDLMVGYLKGWLKVPYVGK